MMTSSTTSFDQDFETGLRLIRESFAKKIAQKDSEIAQLRQELARRDAEIKDLTTRNQHLEHTNARADKRLVEMTRAVTKLRSFKQIVAEKLADDDEEGGGGGAGYAGDERGQERIFGGGSSVDLETSPILPNEFSREDSFMGDTTTRLFSRPSASDRQPDPYTYTPTPTTTPQPQRTPRQTPQPEHLKKQSSHPQLRPSTPTSSRPPPTPQTSQTASPARKQSNVSFAGLDDAVRAQRERSRSRERDVNNVVGGAGSSGSEMGSPNVPSAAGTGHPIDGREFFKKARQTLSYDEFTTLLWNVKAYNNREQSRHRTLDNLADLLSERHRDLYDQFERLLTR